MTPKSRNIIIKSVACAVALSFSGTVSAQETKTFTYDALGRLIEVQKSDGTVTAITFDKAGNRTSYNVGGSANQSPPPAGFVVVPLSGFVVIPIAGSAQ